MPKRERNPSALTDAEYDSIYNRDAPHNLRRRKRNMEKPKKLSAADQRRVEMGLKLRTAREAANLTQWDIARIFGFTSNMYVSNWERGVVYPPRHHVTKLCEILKIDVEPVLNVMKEAWIEREIFGPKKKRS